MATHNWCWHCWVGVWWTPWKILGVSQLAAPCFFMPGDPLALSACCLLVTSWQLLRVWCWCLVLVPGDPLTAACQSHSGPIHHWSFTRPQREGAKWELHTFWARDGPMLPSEQAWQHFFITCEWRIEKCVLANRAEWCNRGGSAMVTVMDEVKVMILVKTVQILSRLM